MLKMPEKKEVNVTSTVEFNQNVGFNRALSEVERLNKDRVDGLVNISEVIVGQLMTIGSVALGDLERFKTTLQLFREK